MSVAPEPIRILAVDDHPIVRRGIAGLISIQPDMILVGEASAWVVTGYPAIPDAPSGRYADGPANAGNERH